MSPLRRRKSRASRARARRQELIQRERQEYGLERTDLRPGEPADAVEPELEAPEAIEAELEPTEAVEAEPAAAPEVEAPLEKAPPLKRREFQQPSRVAQRRRRPRRRRRRRLRIPKPDLGGLRSASTTGARATVRQASPGVRRLLSRLGRILTWVLAWPLRLAAFLAGLITGLLRGARAFGARVLALAERYVTPERVLVAVTAAAAGCLAYSQFVNYRGVEVGQPQYVGVSTIAPPPQVDPIKAGDAHAYVLLPLAAIAVVIALMALISRRWQLGRLVSVIGLAGIAISLAIDLPKGLDAGTAGNAFAGAKATLTNGFYAQLAASAVLVLCGWVLAINLRGPRAAKARRRRTRRRRPRPRRTPSVARGGA